MTRQFNIDPRLLCQQHLLGEHSEMHEGVGLIRSDNCPWAESQMEGQARSGNIDTSWFQPRHDVLAAELERRGMNHDSPMEYNDELDIGDGAVCPDESAGSLLKCPDCRERIQSLYALIEDEEVVRDERGKRVASTKWYPESGHPFDTRIGKVADQHDSLSTPEA